MTDAQVAIYFVGGVVGSVYAVVEALKHRSYRKNGIPPSFTASDRQMLRDLYKNHSVKDEDGTPLWYMPRRMLKDQEEANGKLGEILAELKSLNVNFDRWNCPHSKK